MASYIKYSCSKYIIALFRNNIKYIFTYEEQIRNILYKNNKKPGSNQLIDLGFFFAFTMAEVKKINLTQPLLYRLIYNFMI